MTIDTIKDEWDLRIPETPEDVISLLRRRIEIHSRWREFCLEGSERAGACEDHGTGSAESHQTYINDQSD